jgi:hypothetical protein
MLKIYIYLGKFEENVPYKEERAKRKEQRGTGN